MRNSRPFLVCLPLGRAIIQQKVVLNDCLNRRLEDEIRCQEVNTGCSDPKRDAKILSKIATHFDQFVLPGRLVKRCT